MSPQPSFSCPRCGYETFLPSDIAAGYCPSCRWWTGDSLLGGEDVMAQNAIDGPLAEQALWQPFGGMSFAEACENLARSFRAVADAVGISNDVIARWAEGIPSETRADIEADWFGAPLHHEITVDMELTPEGVEHFQRLLDDHEAGRTYRVARFVRALRRFRR